ncbi:DUF4255 domain-containing protein [Mucilaginibacter robiniae]|uniref:DUF4255 domain-containing protein n=1 Tax=Mucilaginibacter robiniae TaxID=2728022 RepID=A0A7L5E117_9SPHI|nr:DUF4255 domain-containing protein [Mucilaginibacter robiniae]QJD96198.1 DUF4255 domain-containing protein [Mucilaginibacter robiniae]
MIYEALKCIAEEINELFRVKLKVNDDRIIISGLTSQDGSTAIQSENKIVITLVNIEKEINGLNAGSTLSAGQSVKKNQSTNVNLTLMFSAYFAANNYPEALRFISFIIAYFQSNGVFTHANTPGLDSRIDKMMIEMVNFSPEQHNNIWSMLGAKYMPSVIYKLRMLTFNESIIQEIRPAITGLGQQTSAKP